MSNQLLSVVVTRLLPSILILPSVLRLSLLLLYLLRLPIIVRITTVNPVDRRCLSAVIGGNERDAVRWKPGRREVC